MGFQNMYVFKPTANCEENLNIVFWFQTNALRILWKQDDSECTFANQNVPQMYCCIDKKNPGAL